jgi:CDP-glycerol glycerophosphotransferase (TagB/SpsB family)
VNSITKRIVKLLSYIIPAKKNHWIAIHSDKNWTGNQRAFFDYVIDKDEKYVSILILGESSDKELRSIYGSSIKILRDSKLTSWFHFLRAEAVFTHNFAHGDLHSNVINLWHGIPLKSIGHLRPNRSKSFLKKLGQYSLLISSSNIDRYAMTAAFGLPVSKVIASGLPRNDMLLNEISLPVDLLKQDQRIKKSLNGRKLALFAPTFRDHRLNSKFRHFSKDELNQLISLLEDKGYALGVRGHHRHDDLDLPQDTRIIDCSGIEYPEMQILIKNTDLFITDYSGGFYDFLIMNKPLISFAPDLVEYSQNHDFTHDFQSIFPGPICTEFIQLKDAISMIENKSHDESWRTKRETVRKLLIGNNTGQACDVIYKRVCGNS